MFGFRYFKANPTTHVIQYRDGEAVREGAGLAFWYFAPTSSLVAIPMQSTEAPFMFKEVSADFQEVTVQGQVTFRVSDPARLASLMDFTLDPAALGYTTEEPDHLPQRVVNAVQVRMKGALQQLPLAELLRSSERLVSTVRAGLRGGDGLGALGLELTDLAVLAIKPTPETARALEAHAREAILKHADDAIYARRNAAIEQERSVKENELRTEIAVEQKKREIRETQLGSEQMELEKRQALRDRDMAGRITLEEKNRTLVQLTAENSKRQAEAKAYGVAATMKALIGADPKVLQALNMSGAEPAQLIAQAFQELASNAAKVGELNISPDLLQQLMKKRAA